MQNTYKKNYIGRLLIVIIGLALILAVSFYSAHNIKVQTEDELQANLEDVAQENTINIKNQIDSKYKLLQALAKEVEAGDEGIDITKLNCFVETYNLRRLGFCDANGMTYATSGDVTDLSFREFYVRAMHGKNTISGILLDAMSDDRSHISIMSVPVYNDAGEPDGLVAITYELENFNDSLEMNCFDGQGGCFAVNEKNEVIVAKGNVPVQLAENYRHSAAESQISDGLISRDGKDYFYEAIPLSLMDGDVSWTIYTIVPTSVLNSRVQTIHNNLILLNVVLVLTVILGAGVYVFVTKNQRQALNALAYEDMLTGGDNFAAFRQKLSYRKNLAGAFVHMDIRNFSLVNITLGSEQGDQLIKDSWNVIQGTLEEHDVGARVKDDCFIIYYADCDKTKSALRLRDISKAITDMAAARKVNGIRPVFGIYVSTEQDTTEEAYSKAAVAAEVAKSGGNDRAYYDDIDHVKLRTNRELEERFPDALKNREFRVWYQPKFRTSDEKLVGAEALIRWVGGDGNMIMPGTFIPLFESNGRISELDEFVFSEVCTQIRRWSEEGARVVPVSVNLSRASLFHSDVLTKYLQILSSTGADPSYIQLEITESAMEGRNNIRDILEGLRNNGIKILMDDFGTGYSALSTLNSGCFDVLKVDKSLVDDIGTDRGETLLHCVIDMGHQLGLSITAEGVEEKVQLEYLRREGCDDIQGYYFSRPLPLEDFEKILRDNT